METCPTCGAPVTLVPDGEPRYEPPPPATTTVVVRAHEGVPHLCPVCHGRGTVPPDFYQQMGVAASMWRQPCCSCDATGIVWGKP